MNEVIICLPTIFTCTATPLNNKFLKQKKKPEMASLIYIMTVATGFAGGKHSSSTKMKSLRKYIL